MFAIGHRFEQAKRNKHKAGNLLLNSYDEAAKHASVFCINISHPEIFI